MQVEVQQLDGIELDYAVAIALGGHGMFHDTVCSWWIIIDERPRCLSGGWSDTQNFQPHVSIKDAWPIIDRENIVMRPTFTTGGYRTSDSIDAVHAQIELPNGSTVWNVNNVIWVYGPTKLIAAMRCFVRAKLGDRIDIPECILNAKG